MTDEDRDVAAAGECFDFDVAPWARLPLALIGVTPRRCALRIDDAYVHIAFGPWRTALARDNIRTAEVVGPFRPWKVLGVRLSLKDRGLTFGTSARRGVCIRFWRPMAIVGPGWLLRHPAVTVTPTAARRFAAALPPHSTATGS